MDKSRVEPTIFFIDKISFSLILFSGHFYGQSFIKTVRGPYIKSFGVRILPLLKSAKFNPKNIDKKFTLNIPAWCMNHHKILFDLHSCKRSETSPIIMNSSFNELKSNYTNYTHSYTDGSKDDMRVGCVVVSDNYSENMRIPDGSSIFTAEAKAFD